MTAVDFNDDINLAENEAVVLSTARIVFGDGGKSSDMGGRRGSGQAVDWKRLGRGERGKVLVMKVGCEGWGSSVGSYAGS
ncbi:hypothetical protein B296_00012205 [Ensete ventricosum]|uniref:Uncharacterized protein n=1 Tax=Ensete ventricosum TaxID=4639 RepID=A0A427AU97_ENSVE|nr:hypothetical protein B296_00012205 [Ensete ventricosum]